MAEWRLFLDDERYPPAPPDARWHIARSVDDAMWLVRELGVPSYMSLDHDLGANRFTGMDFVKRFCDHLMDTNAFVPYDFAFEVHSMNPPGAENMREYLNSFFDNTFYRSLGTP